jgi:hypothetical protein
MNTSSKDEMVKPPLLNRKDKMSLKGGEDRAEPVDGPQVK